VKSQEVIKQEAKLILDKEKKRQDHSTSNFEYNYEAPDIKKTKVETEVLEFNKSKLNHIETKETPKQKVEDELAHFDKTKLHHTETKETPKQKVEDELTHFDKTKLHHTETKVTNSMVEEEKPKEIQTEGK